MDIELRAGGGGGLARAHAMRPVVVKLGGSLAREPVLRDWLALLAQAGAAGQAVVVPGGGAFADQVRAAQELWRFSDRVAHAMALLAMDQYARMLCGIEPRLQLAEDEIGMRACWSRGQTAIWLPAASVLHDPSIEASWDVTSDTLAAWLAARLKARALVLVKALAEAELARPLEALAQSGVVDQAFPRALVGRDFAVELVSKTQIEVLSALLREPV